MKRKTVIASVVLVASVIAVSIPTALARLKPTARFVGPGVISTTASNEVVQRAVDSVYLTLRKPSAQTQGDKSHKISSQSWKSGKDRQSTALELVRTKKQFDDRQGQPIAIETIAGRKMQTLIFISSTGDVLVVTNAIFRELKKQGINVTL